jgi:8-oxo-dGTP pyrophosphatase MutT (NUDIX family)
MKQIKLHTAGLVVLKRGKLLLAFSKNKKAWYLPGGKVDTGETSEEAILREVAEELDISLDPKLVKFYCHITAPAYGERQNIIMEQDCYMYELTENVSAKSEIEEIGYFDLETYKREPAQAPGVLLLFEKLRQDGLTD